MLPGKDGLSVLKEIRERYPGLPVIMLTARSEYVGRVVGLVSNLIAGPVLELARNARRVAAGRLDVRVKPQGPLGGKRYRKIQRVK